MGSTGADGIDCQVKQAIDRLSESPKLMSPMLSLFHRAQQYEEKVAIATPDGQFTYAQLLVHSAQVATLLLAGRIDLQEERVAFLVPAGFDYVVTQWGIWRSGGIAVPLCVTHPYPELAYVMAQSGATILVAHPQFAAMARSLAEGHPCRVILTSDWQASDWQADATARSIASLPNLTLDRRALILYTSGTTGKPKGVVSTHGNLEAQVTSLVSAWGWTEDDRILHVLPLHHIHGIVNVLTCALWSGALCYMLPKFDAELVWQHLCSGGITLFMAVPTIYTKLITAWEKCDRAEQERRREGCRAIRLMVSGSAALPVPILEQWQHITGHFLLERYGMTEIGMALSNPLQGDRQAGSVGKPLPQVQVRLVDEQGQAVPPGVPGEIQVQGPGVFLEYWQNPTATAKVFRDRWFCTGDLAVVEDDRYRILGRISVDIIKTGGYKVSALEIEEVLLTHPQVQECAVVGVPDPEWGERVCAALVLRSDTTVNLTHLAMNLEPSLNLETLRSWAKERIAPYKVPTRLIILESLPRNVMGKLTKPAIVQLFGYSRS
ncbi:MAG: acyl-CoA synthetase [Synechococcales bacterium]|nr:acyl-CoA synthetase [Synechococcales bacterium]